MKIYSVSKKSVLFEKIYVFSIIFHKKISTVQKIYVFFIIFLQKVTTVQVFFNFKFLMW